MKNLKKFDAGIALDFGRQVAEQMGGKVQYKNHVDFLNDVQQAGIPGAEVPERLRFCQMNAVGSDEARIASNPDGGFLIPASLLEDEKSTNIDGSQLDTGALTQKLEMETVQVRIPARVDKDHSTSVSGGFRVYRREETGTVDASRGAYEQITLEARSVMGISFATNELMKSTSIMAALVQRGFDTEFKGKLNNERIFGTGVGEYLGAMSSACLITVPKETQTTDTIVDANVRKMAARCWGFANAVWMVNSNCLGQIAALADFNPETFTLLGRPLFLDENMKTLGDLGDVLLANWNEYLEGSLGGTSLIESIHVRFIYDENCFRFTAYNDGQPWWRSPLTPKNGSDTMSPFVTLQAR